MTVTIDLAALVGLRPAQIERQASSSGARTRTQEATEVMPVRTRLTLSQASKCLGTAWSQVFGESPPPRAIALLAAQWSHETGQGASMFNFNFGGIKGLGPGGLTVSQRTKEGWGATERSIVDRFRAYSSAEEGAVDYVKLLAKRFPGAIQAARQGDPTEFVHQLKARGYFTGDENTYASSVSRLASQALKACGESGSNLLPPSPSLPRQATELRLPRSEPDPYALAGTSAVTTVAQLITMNDALTRAALSISAAEALEFPTQTRPRAV